MDSASIMKTAWALQTRAEVRDECLQVTDEIIHRQSPSLTYSASMARSNDEARSLDDQLR